MSVSAATLPATAGAHSAHHREARLAGELASPEVFELLGGLGCASGALYRTDRPAAVVGGCQILEYADTEC